MTLRLFAAVPIPEEIAERLLSLEAEVPGASWRDAEQYHLTLRFFGEIDEALARDLDHELGQIVETPFEIRLAGAGSFGGREPTALWAGVEASPELMRLNAACEKAARRAGSSRRRAGSSRTSPSPTAMERAIAMRRTSTNTPPASAPSRSG